MRPVQNTGWSKALGHGVFGRGTVAPGLVQRGDLPILLGSHQTIFDRVTTGDKGCLVVKGNPSLLMKRVKQVVKGWNSLLVDVEKEVTWLGGDQSNGWAQRP